jgi:hypothetical protein
MFTCVSCGQLTSQHTLLSEDDADKRAIDDLGRQAQRLSGPMATLTRARRNQLIAEVSAEKSFKTALNKARRQLITTLEMASVSQDPMLLLSFDDDQLLDLILRGGLGLAVEDFIDNQERIRLAIERSLEVIEPEFNLNNLPQLDLIQGQAVAQVFEDVILPDTKRAVRDALTSITLDIPASVVFSDLNERLKKSVGRQLTEVKTSISQYGRSINAAAAAAAGLKNYLYTGPMDGLTRPFCIPLVNKVVTEKQMTRLNNGQGLAVKTSGGGYNCRHSWSPVSEGFIISADLNRATKADILAANSKRAKRR